MGLWSVLLFGDEEEIKLKQFKELFDIKDDETAKTLYSEIKTKLESE